MATVDGLKSGSAATASCHARPSPRTGTCSTCSNGTCEVPHDRDHQDLPGRMNTRNGDTVAQTTETQPPPPSGEQSTIAVYVVAKAVDETARALLVGAALDVRLDRIGSLGVPHYTVGRLLTEREMAVLTGMAHGQSNADIGRTLFLSEDTVKSHARTLFRKIGARDRAHAVAIGYERGILGGS